MKRNSFFLQIQWCEKYFVKVSKFSNEKFLKKKIIRYIWSSLFQIFFTKMPAVFFFFLFLYNTGSVFGRLYWNPPPPLLSKNYFIENVFKLTNMYFICVHVLIRWKSLLRKILCITLYHWIKIVQKMIVMITKNSVDFNPFFNWVTFCEKNWRKFKMEKQLYNQPLKNRLKSQKIDFLKWESKKKSFL